MTEWPLDGQDPWVEPQATTELRNQWQMILYTIKLELACHSFCGGLSLVLFVVLLLVKMVVVFQGMEWNVEPCLNKCKMGKKMIGALGRPTRGRMGWLMAAVSTIRIKFSTMIQFSWTKSGLTFQLFNTFHSSSELGEVGFGTSHCHSCLVNIKTANQNENVHACTLDKIIKSLMTSSQATGRRWV